MCDPFALQSPTFSGTVKSLPQWGQMIVSPGSQALSFLPCEQETRARESTERSAATRRSLRMSMFLWCVSPYYIIARVRKKP